MGRELFDHAFKTYSQRWMFKHPSPADFFRTMEDASAVDLDWFWRGWFYTTDHVDIALDEVQWYRLDTKNPEVELAAKKKERAASPRDITTIRNEEAITRTQDEIDPSLRDFYSSYDPLEATILDQEEYNDYLSTLNATEKELVRAGNNFYEITFRNLGGLVMPLIVEFEFTDGSKELHSIPAEIWRKNSEVVTKTFIHKKMVKAIALDPFLETADIDTSNNHYPKRQQLNRFELYKQKAQRKKENPMQRDQRAKKKSGTN